jgi:hypothetical protein
VPSSWSAVLGLSAERFCEAPLGLARFASGVADLGDGAVVAGGGPPKHPTSSNEIGRLRATKFVSVPPRAGPWKLAAIPPPLVSSMW